MLRLEESKFIFSELVSSLVAKNVRLNLRDCELYSDSTPEVQNVSKWNKSFPSRSNYASNRNLKCTRCSQNGHLVNICYANINRNVYKFNSNASNFHSNVNKSKIFHGRKKFVKKSGACPQAHSLKFESPQNFLIAESSFNFNDISGEVCWIFNTAASHHFCKNKKLVSELHPVTDEKMLLAVHGITFPIKGKDKINFIFNGKLYIFCDMLYSSKLWKNLISGPYIDSKGGHYIRKDQKVMAFGQGGEHMFSDKLMNGTY